MSAARFYYNDSSKNYVIHASHTIHHYPFLKIKGPVHATGGYEITEMIHWLTVTHFKLSRESQFSMTCKYHIYET